MKDGSINLVDLDFEYKIWKNRLDLFRREIAILKDRNEEIKDETSEPELNTVEIMVLDEHSDQLLQLQNRIKVQEQELQYYNKDFPITREHQYFLVHEVLRKKMESLTKLHLDRLTDLVDAMGIG